MHKLWTNSLKLNAYLESLKSFPSQLHLRFYLFTDCVEYQQNDSESHVFEFLFVVFFTLFLFLSFSPYINLRLYNTRYAYWTRLVVIAFRCS